ncbi:hypothetical protein QYE76_015268 [Lolium multiflorum]|uniref:Integrase catalytic domain-containing protein n=1 Tax=Lolium multiflorum TaxID=4521 RepID=A0AAD8U299_LOLMU|nr:hypothetical protein QYE76_015268 [Lolium multiflorum]
MNPIIKPWPFRGWGMDMIGKIHPSSKGHVWVLAITDYFTKWVEAVPMKAVASSDVIDFVREHVIHGFGIPQTITTDGGSVFVSKEFRKFCEDMGIKLIRSSPYYAQANGQAEASNKSLIKLIKRKIDEHPRRWHEPAGSAGRWVPRGEDSSSSDSSAFFLLVVEEKPPSQRRGRRRCRLQLPVDEESRSSSPSVRVSGPPVRRRNPSPARPNALAGLVNGQVDLRRRARWRRKTGRIGRGDGGGRRVHGG